MPAFWKKISTFLRESPVESFLLALAFGILLWLGFPRFYGWLSRSWLFETSSLPNGLIVLAALLTATFFCLWIISIRKRK